MARLRRLYGLLHLKVKETKSAVASAIAYGLRLKEWSSTAYRRKHERRLRLESGN